MGDVVADEHVRQRGPRAELDEFAVQQPQPCIGAQGDVTRQLVFKYIAARLNQAAFGVPSDVAGLLLEIEDYFDSDGVDNGDPNDTDLYSQPVGSNPSGAAKDYGKQLFSAINDYFATVGEAFCPDPSQIPELQH